MEIRWLGWAGVECRTSDGATLVIDALADAAATFASAGERAARVPLPELVAPEAGRAVAALATHLHRDHTDGDAIDAALSPSGRVFTPAGDHDSPALQQAAGDLARLGLDARRTALGPWETATAGPFTITALPAVDGLGDPQSSYLVEADGHRLLHAGDTMFHGYWWRIARTVGPIDLALLPINGPVISFPHLQPASSQPAALTPEQALIAARGLTARRAAPIHYGAFDFPPVYTPIADASARFSAAAASADQEIVVPAPGDWIQLEERR